MSDINISANLQAMLDAMPESYQKTIGYPTYDILAAISPELDKAAINIDDIRSKLDPANLTGAELDSYIYSRTGQRRKPAAAAVGEVVVTGHGTVYEGDLFESAGGIQFYATKAVEINGTGTVPICCTKPGSMGNLPPGSITLMPVQLAGIVSVTNITPTHDGYDAETDAAYYERFIVRVQTPPTSGNVFHYMTWALEVPGVGAVQVIPLGRGDNTVEIIIVDANGQPASSELVAAVQDHIDPNSEGLGHGEAPIGAYCYVSAAAQQAVPVSALVTAMPGVDHDQLTELIKSSITSYLAEIAFKQDYISYGRIAAAILNTPGVLDFENLRINGSTGNVMIQDKYIAVLGEVTITYA